MSDTVNIFTKILHIFSNRGIDCRLTLVTVIRRPMIYPFFLPMLIYREFSIFRFPLVVCIRRPIRLYTQYHFTLFCKVSTFHSVYQAFSRRFATTRLFVSQRNSLHEIVRTSRKDT